MSGVMDLILQIVLIVLACLLFLCLLRAVRGPRVSDRLVAVNMMGTLVMVMIAILAVLLGEGYLVDICLIYAMVSFLSVIVLTKVYMGVYLQRKEESAQAAESAHEAEGVQVAEGVRTGENAPVAGSARVVEGVQDREGPQGMDGVRKREDLQRKKGAVKEPDQQPEG